MAWPQATIPLGDIIASYELGLVLIVGRGNSPRHTPTLDIPVQWVHTSDLADPSPFLVPRMVLLTTGSQFQPTLTRAEAEAYVDRLVASGVSALGFGVGLRHDRTPHTLIDACEHADLPLFRVPYATPFLAISQIAARMLATKSYEREIRSLETQRAISRAALRARGLSAAIETLASRLGRWVALYTPAGTVAQVSPAQAVPLAHASWVRQHITELVARGTRAHVTRQHADTRIHLQTLTTGSRSRVHGVLVVDQSTPLDPSDHASVELVATLASLNAAQRGMLESGEAALRSSVMALLASGEVDHARRVAQASGWRLPTSDAIVVVIEGGHNVSDAVRTAFGPMDDVHVAEYDEDLVLIAPPGAFRRLESALSQIGARAGASRVCPLEHFGDAISEARTARSHPTDSGSAITRFVPRMGESLFSLIADEPPALSRARQLLSPITEYDARHGEQLVATLQAWLEHHGQNSPTATSLGVHRHTVASRMKLIASLAQRDLADPRVRAELWFALELTHGPENPNPAA